MMMMMMMMVVAVMIMMMVMLMMLMMLLVMTTMMMLMIGSDWTLRVVAREYSNHYRVWIASARPNVRAPARTATRPTAEAHTDIVRGPSASAVTLSSLNLSTITPNVLASLPCRSGNCDALTSVNSTAASKMNVSMSRTKS